MFARIARFAAALALATVAVGITPVAAETTLRFHQWLSPKHPIVARTLLPWFERVEKATEGRVKIEYMAAPLGPPPAQFDLVSNGAADLAMNVHGFTPGRFKLTQIGELPFLSTDSEPLSVAFWRTHEKHFAAANEHAGVKLITLFAARPGALWSRDTPIRTLDDWKGKKIFTGINIPAEITEMLGGVAVRAPGPKVYEMLQRKIVDAAFIDHSSYKDFNLDQFIHYAMEAPKGFYSATFYVVMNQKAWDALSPADQQAIDAISGEALARVAGANWDDEARKAMDLMKKNNVVVIKAEGAYLQELEQRIVPPLQDRYNKLAAERGVDGNTALAYLREQIARETR